ncbi:hypothetical protein DFAR_3380014 [Desulfarculales bacterium]
MSQGRGKMGRFFRTVRAQFLPGFKGDALRDINEALKCWIRDVYHQRKHLGTGQAPCNVSPARWSASGRPTPTWKATSKKRTPRRVVLDRTVSLAGRLYEAPVPLIGKQITTLYHGHDPDRVEVLDIGPRR